MTAHDEIRRTARPWRRALLPIAVLLSAAIATAGYLRARGIGARQIAESLASVGGHWWTPLLLVGLYVVANLLLLPGTPLTLAAGAIWAWPLSALWAVVASTIGTIAPYLLARQGAGRLAPFLRRRTARLQGALEQKGFMTLLLLRLNPIIPYNVLNYAAGVAGVRGRDYLAATLLGSIPGILVYTYLASAIVSGAESARSAVVRVLLAGAVLTALALASRLVARRMRRRAG